MRLKMCFCY